jgi:hypothetical protein
MRPHSPPAASPLGDSSPSVVEFSSVTPPCLFQRIISLGVIQLLGVGTQYTCNDFRAILQSNHSIDPLVRALLWIFSGHSITGSNGLSVCRTFCFCWCIHPLCGHSPAPILCERPCAETKHYSGGLARIGVTIYRGPNPRKGK